MDEAHRIAGRADKKWAAINDPSRILADRHLYMTATTRAIVDGDLADSADPTRPRPRPRRRRREPDLDPFANSMDNEAIYGKKFFEYPLATAVGDGRAADYRIVVPTLTDADLRKRLNLPAPGDGGDHDEQRKQRAESALRGTALHIAVLRAMTEHGLRRVLVYFNLVSDARPRMVRSTRSHAKHCVIATGGRIYAFEVVAGAPPWLRPHRCRDAPPVSGRCRDDGG